MYVGPACVFEKTPPATDASCATSSTCFTNHGCKPTCDSVIAAVGPKWCNDEAHLTSSYEPTASIVKHTSQEPEQVGASCPLTS